MEATKFPGIKPPAPGAAIRLQGEGVAIAVFNVEGQLLAVDAKCTHVGGPLEKGLVANRIITCPWHGSQFDLQTGHVVRGPAVKPIVSYRVQVDPDGITIAPS